MEEELRRILREYGWNLFKRRRGEKEYFYAQKWMKGEVYIATLANLATLTREEVVQKIAR